MSCTIVIISTDIHHFIFYIQTFMNAVYYESELSDEDNGMITSTWKKINSPLGSSLKMVLSLHWTVWDLEVGQTQTHSLLALVILIWVHWLNWMMRKIMSGRNYIRRKRRKGSQSCRIPKHQEIWFSHNRTEIDLCE